MARRQPPSTLLLQYGALALAGFIGETTCVVGYRYYEYHAPWHTIVGVVPLLVPLIWPLVILSARDVVSALWPRAQGWRPVLVGAVVVLDASLVEVVAVRAGLWRWAEPGYLGVPIIGILGWGYFAAAAELFLVRPTGRRVALIVLGAPLGAHALIQLSWWGLFRGLPRVDVSAAGSLAAVLVGVGTAAAVLRERRAGHVVAGAIALPRMVAALLFLTLLVAVAPTSGPLWLHVAAVALPYLVATDWRSFTSKRLPGGPPLATTPSR